MTMNLQMYVDLLKEVNATLELLSEFSCNRYLSQFGLDPRAKALKAMYELVEVVGKCCASNMLSGKAPDDFNTAVWDVLEAIALGEDYPKLQAKSDRLRKVLFVYTKRKIEKEVLS
jgi:hypothetical protein